MKTQLRLLLVPNPCSLAGVAVGLASLKNSFLLKLNFIGRNINTHFGIFDYHLRKLENKSLPGGTA